MCLVDSICIALYSFLFAQIPFSHRDFDLSFFKYFYKFNIPLPLLCRQVKLDHPLYILPHFLGKIFTNIMITIFLFVLSQANMYINF